MMGIGNPRTKRAVKIQARHASRAEGVEMPPSGGVNTSEKSDANAGGMKNDTGKIETSDHNDCGDNA
jgi:hypothetical protein